MSWVDINRTEVALLDPHIVFLYQGEIIKTLETAENREEESGGEVFCDV